MGILQARIQEWVTTPFSRGSSPPRDWTYFCFFCSGRRVLYRLSHLGNPVISLLWVKWEFISINGKKATHSLSMLHSSLIRSGMEKYKGISGEPNKMSSNWAKPEVREEHWEALDPEEGQWILRFWVKFVLVAACLFPPCPQTLLCSIPPASLLNVTAQPGFPDPSLIPQTLFDREANGDLKSKPDSNACMLSCFSGVWLFVAPWTPLSMGFSRQEYWSELPCPPPGISSWSRTEPTALMAHAPESNTLA